MRLLVEIGRFVVTALAVGLAIPTILMFLSLLTDEHFSYEGFIGLGTITFFLALIGGAVFGLPTLWLLKRLRRADNIFALAITGTVVGAIGGVVLSVAFWQGNGLIILAGLWIWASMGGVAGLVSALGYFCLHKPDGEVYHA